jgi:hypothetical protein
MIIWRWHILIFLRGELSNEIVCSLDPTHRSKGKEYVYTISVDCKSELLPSLKEFFEVFYLMI